MQFVRGTVEAEREPGPVSDEFRKELEDRLAKATADVRKDREERFLRLCSRAPQISMDVGSPVCLGRV